MSKSRDLLIRVYGRSDDQSGYAVDAELDDNSYFFGGELRMDDAELLPLNLNIPAYGAKLGQYLFSPPIQKAFEKARASMDDDPDTQLRVRLCFGPDAQELHAYPWERLLTPWNGTPLAASSRMPFSRFVQLPEGPQAPIEERPIRLVFAVSNPTGLPTGLQAIDVGPELASLVAAVSKVDDLHVSILPGRTPLTSEARAALAATGCEILPGNTTLDSLAVLSGQNHIVHILSHGLYRDGVASLCLEDEHGVFALAEDTAIAALIQGLARKPRLIYLSACQSAMQDPDDLAPLKRRAPHPMVGLAPKLVEVEVPAVLAMQDLVAVGLAHNLAAEFYKRLLDSGEVDRSLSEARLSVYNKDSRFWAVPALFLRLKQGRLFAADPAREALNAVRARYPLKEQRYYLPLEAVSIETRPLIQNWERASEDSHAATDLWAAVQQFQPGITVVLGEPGSGKSTLLERIAGFSAQPANQAGPRVVPLIVDLRDFATIRTYTDSRLRGLAFAAFQELAPSLNEEGFEALLNQDSIRFRLLFDQMDDLPDRLRNQVIEELNLLARDLSNHQFVLVMERRCFRPWPQIDQLLVMQPLSPRKIGAYLNPDDGGPPDKARAALLHQLYSAELLELASVPWLLRDMLDQARENILPQSQISVLRDWLQRSLYKVADDGGRSLRAAESLCALARKMQSSRLSALQLEDTFQVLGDVRGQRDYRLEDLLSQLTASGIVVRFGDESIRFAYPPLQAFCAARQIEKDPERNQIIEEIVATLGQASRVRWWKPTLALLAGITDDPAPLIKSLVYGASLMQGEQLFVAGECFHAYDREHPGKVKPDLELESLRQQICAALLWRSKRVHEPDVDYRTSAVDLLGMLNHQESIPQLTFLAADRARTLEGKEPNFEYSQVRFAAVRALRRMQTFILPEHMAEHPNAPALIAAWTNSDTAGLKQLLSGEDEGLQGVAAFALGDLQRPAGAAVLYAAFRDSKTLPATLWAITDALQDLDPSDLFAQLILPFVEEANAEPLLVEDDRHDRMIYLIGQLRNHHPAALAYVERYLATCVSERYKGRALVASGQLHISRAPGWWMKVAGDTVFLQRKAIQALGEYGDLQLLYGIRHDQPWVPELDEAFFRAAEACMAFPNADLIQGDTDGTARLHARGF